MDRSIGSREHRRLCHILRELRIEVGLTQVELAARLGMPQPFVSKYEGGSRRLDLIELRRVVDALGIAPGVLLERFDPTWLRAE